ncbi:MAG: acyl carrier protein [Butyrivibrio sp.]
MTIKEYNKVFMNVFSLTEEQLNGDVEMGNIQDWDSIGHVKLITLIEDTFDIMLETEDILNFTSYEKGKEILRKYEINL